MTKIPYANLYAEYLECQESVDDAITRCVANSSFINGPEVSDFEQHWAFYTQSRACAGVSSGTSALMLALSALGVKSGDEVIVPSMSFISTAEAVSQLGAIPVFVDIDQYHTMDISMIKSRFTERTTAIIFVDLYGQTVDIDAIKSIANHVVIIEDAAQASGCQYRGQPTGDLVDATCWSFYPGKNLSAMGDAGAVTGCAEVVERIKMLRDHGRREKYKHEFMGWNERLDGLQAAILSAKLPWLNEWNQRRQRNASIYYERLEGWVDLPRLNPISSHVYNQFVIEIEQREKLRQYLADHLIETGVQFPIPMHLQPVYQSKICLPRSERLAQKCLSLPVHAHCSPDDIHQVCDKIQEFFS